MKTAEAIEELFKLFDENILIRDTSNDHDFKKFTEQGIRITKVLAELKLVSQQQPSSMGDYKCHVETNVKDSEGNPVFVDKCLKDTIELLNKQGIKTIASCCGHGKISPTILIGQQQPSRHELWNAFKEGNSFAQMPEDDIGIIEKDFNEYLKSK